MPLKNWIIACAFATSVLATARPIATPVNSFERMMFEEGVCDVIKSRKNWPYLPQQCCGTADRTFAISPVVNSTETPLEDTPLIITCASISYVPHLLPTATKKMSLRGTSIRQLDQQSFNKSSLENFITFSLSDDDVIESIGARTFIGLNNLRRIYLENLKNLMFISESAFSGLPRLDRIVIKGTDIGVVQGFTELWGPTENAVTIELSHNPSLAKIQSRAFRNLTERVTELRVTMNPNLRTVEDFAFAGSRIYDLYLDGNGLLTDLQSFAFAGMKNLRYLSIAKTSVMRLPTIGLEKMQELNAFDTPYMIRFPTSDKLPSLHKAVLTYPFHCCALTNYGFGEIFQNDETNQDEELVDCAADDERTSPEIPQQIQPPVSSEGFVDSPTLVEPTVGDVEANYYHVEEYDYAYYNDSFDDSIQYIPLPTDGEEHEVLPEVPTSSEDVNGLSAVNPPDGSWVASHNSFGGLPVATGHAIHPNVTTHPWNSSTPRVISLCRRDKSGKLVPKMHEAPIHCVPVPDLFNPCEDLLGSTGIVAVSWSVACLSVIGNFFVIFMLLAVACDRTRAQQRHLSVPKFLILNLAIGDFFMGIYLFTLTAMDSRSSGNYYKFGVEWQTGGGCDVAGFIAIFASQLSVFTLSVISLERWYAIRYAIQLDKRMTLRCGRIVMCVGWIVSIILAALPLMKVNSYRKTAICLPMDVQELSGKVYVAVLLSLDICAFMVVVGSYLWMYAIVRSANGTGRSLRDLFRLKERKQADERPRHNHNNDGCFGVMDSRKTDARVAKRMAVLVFTDFACFFPICFFSLFALAGLPLLSMSTAKVLLITCFPFNACCNPFLYAILTKSFRNDVKMFIKSQRPNAFGVRRQKTSHRREKRSDGGSRQEERRKTIQVYVDYDAEHANGGEGVFVSVEQKPSPDTKKSFSCKFSAKQASCSLSFKKKSTLEQLSPKREPLKSGSPSNHNNNNSAKDKTVITNRNSDYAGDSGAKGLSKSLAVLAAFSRIRLSMFRKRNASTNDAPPVTETTRQTSFETQVSADGGVALCEKTDSDSSESEIIVSKVIDFVVAEASMASLSSHSDQDCFT
uniref:lutropin-choriogonadotropic hormone receptor n=1 Tax=Ciona intestinalis TaxID=7719 RepID=UPI00089DA9C8|nr:lutropin-choriogonadotropic hormone receptor [Ciona intestinalis]|eukprot:XP_018670060.1 lutropin-choriogonadotropic hormone receptor [Ciona intestinalis]